MSADRAGGRCPGRPTLGSARIEILSDGRFQRDFVRGRPMSLSELARRLDDCQAMRVFVDNHERVIHAPLRSSAEGSRR